jgi:NAD(P)-dependent dehydrogenase (short-subunit alcohol dehydrogenase family)
MSLLGLTAVVTGAASGIGLAVADRFTEEGARVAALDISHEGLDVLCARNPEVLGIKCDVANDGDVERAFARVDDELNRIDLLVNAAGIRPTRRSLAEFAVSDWDREVAVHLRGCFLCSQQALARLLAQGHGGSIINVASAAGIRGVPGIHAYVAAKHAIVGLTKAAALENWQFGIRVNAIAPGAVDTPLFRGDKQLSEAHKASLRVSEPVDVANIAVFLAGDGSRSMSGAIISADGGTTAGFLDLHDRRPPR